MHAFVDLKLFVFIMHAFFEVKLKIKGIFIFGHAKITSSLDFSLEIEQLSIKGLESASLFHLHFLPRSRMRVEDRLALAWFVAPESTLAPLPNFTQASYDQVNELIHAKYVAFIDSLKAAMSFTNRRMLQPTRKSA